ncbi:ribosomal protein S18-alanine N-acetyltransferase [Aquibacillus sp. 3ASR75-11]|uniref:[Ribosomal protein bS18]-alanine N-acetyltransferase n=1 Tax=Terrihalobacillus insolitus TaxID=2950438 RepID=A0A9X4AN73_9BACI|nr:ribosomal protein S18-alanine N-acetyltransferase [Terrihalobacillus insolitus]MDC3414232.1 ribosomal protein S18-alanine N-acetyltransferase [Terrihalobacillus insolitus]MDC3426217.1 ribosomal protein S18-alanine N-acetyltransferase [Terrihalobacillus insolitus]
MPTIRIRKMTMNDLEQVLKLEIASFAKPWTKDIFYNEIQRNQFATYYVLETEKKIIGYCGLWMIIDEAQITNIAIYPAYRGKKFGQMLFQYVLNQAKIQGANKLSLEVRVSNEAAKSMYKKFGLVPGGMRKNYYTDNNEDAIVMWVEL